ncbi:MAG: iron-sulfur cluster carrier protein ApbC [Candidatus Omnitrophica bacterium]|nr:iron-sulfur cluster carrier protein ApbC [Candidatus Omnitrophota bacterium]
MPVTQKEILKALSTINDPDLHRDIVSLDFVKDIQIEGGTVRFKIELTTPACPVRDQMQQEAQKVVAQLPGVSQVEITMTSKVRASGGPSKEKLIPSVRNVIPVASGKGGVGKSTVSANLALALVYDGAKVGLMDADVYGPTVPTLLGITEKPNALGDNRIVPVEKYGLKVMSMGFFIKEGEAVVWRGPMLHKTIEQFLGGVVWRDLDYLIVDLPPGTGDIQLSLCQMIPLTGAVIVSTPQDVALQVAMKAIAMFNKLNCPVLGVIENMSYYLCPHCGKRENIFGSGGAKKAAEKLDLPFLGEIPLATQVRLTSDGGKPIVVSDPTSTLSQAFIQVAEKMAAQVSIQNMKGELQQDIKISF